MADRPADGASRHVLVDSTGSFHRAHEGAGAPATRRPPASRRPTRPAHRPCRRAPCAWSPGCERRPGRLRTSAPKGSRACSPRASRHGRCLSHVDHRRFSAPTLGGRSRVAPLRSAVGAAAAAPAPRRSRHLVAARAGHRARSSPSSRLESVGFARSGANASLVVHARRSSSACSTSPEPAGPARSSTSTSTTSMPRTTS